MAYGASIEVEDRVDESGRVTTHVVPRAPTSPGGQPESERNLRYHVSLSGALDPTHAHAIVATRPITIEVGAVFTKVSVQIRTAHIAYIAFGRIASSEVGRYDELHPGAGRLEERTEEARSISLLFPVVPPDPVEVIAYNGDAARPA